jgi:hypothetical protein
LPPTRLDALLAEAKRRTVTHGDAVELARAVGLVPDAWQERVLRWSGKRLLLNCSRQAGKSTTTSVLALHRALTTAGALVLLISPSLRQSAELFRKVLDAIAKLPARPEMSEENKLSVRFGNGSRIVSLPSSEATIRGFSSVSLIIEDEAAFVDDDLNTAMRPMLAVSDGQMILMSTPNGRRGHFFEAWERGGDAWERVRVTGHEVPRIARAFLDEERRIMGERFRQEYLCEFVNAATGRVYAGFDEERNVGELPALTHHVVGLDFGIVDRNAVCVLGWREHDPTVYVVAAYRVTAGVTEMAKEVKRLDEAYKPDRIVGDVGGMGKSFEADMRRYHAIPIAPAEKHNKVGTIALVNDALREGRVRVDAPMCRDLMEEWLTLPWADSLDDRRENRQREASGYDNHAADAFLYAWRSAYAYVEQPKKRAPQTAEDISREEEERLVRELEDESKLEWWERR